MLLALRASVGVLEIGVRLGLMGWEFMGWGPEFGVCSSEESLLDQSPCPHPHAPIAPLMASKGGVAVRSANASGSSCV